MGGLLKKFLNKAFLENKWLWVHIFAGAIGAKIIIILFDGYWVVETILFLSIAWEILEFFAVNIDDIYGSFKYFVYDAIGDIVGAAAITLVVIA